MSRALELAIKCGIQPHGIGTLLAYRSELESFYAAAREDGLREAAKIAQMQAGKAAGYGAAYESITANAIRDAVLALLPK